MHQVAVQPVLGASVRREKRSFAHSIAWLMLALAGQIAALFLIDAGPFVRYQHLVLPGDFHTITQWLAVAVLALQIGAVSVFGRRECGVAYAWLRKRLAPWRILLLAAAFVAVSAVPSRSPSAYLGETLWASLIQIVNLATIVVALASLPAAAVARVRLAHRRLSGEVRPGMRDGFSITIASAVIVIAAALSIFVYQRHPHVPDEVVYLYHARYFAHGLLTMPAPPVPAAFDLDLMEYEPTRWFSPVPPGWPAILSAGVLLRVPWLINPLLAGACVLLAYGFLRELYTRRTARVATILLAGSPWFLFLAMSFMTHTATLAFALLAAFATARMHRTLQLHWGMIGGLAIGVVALIRPLEGLILAGLLGVWTLGLRGKHFRFAPVVTLAAATIAAVLPVLPYNQALTGNPLRFAINAYTDTHYGVGTNAMGFGANRGLGWSGLDPYPGHGARDVIVNAALNTSTLNLELLGLGCGSLFLLFLLMLSGRISRSDRLMLVALLAVPAVHSFYWFSGGPDFGPRYWFLIIVPLVALSARTLESLAPHRLVAALGLFATLSLAVFVPWRSIDKYHNYRGMRADVRAISQDTRLDNGLVLVRGRRHPDYASAAIYNPLDLAAREPVFAWDRDAATRMALRAAYPHRNVWIMDGPTVTGSGYQLVAGPLRWTEADAYR